MKKFEDLSCEMSLFVHARGFPRIRTGIEPSSETLAKDAERGWEEPGISAYFVLDFSADSG
jgi:hypothetical protein